MKKITLIFILLFLFLPGSNPALAIDSKMSSRLEELIENHKINGIATAKEFCKQKNIEILQGDKIEVIIELPSGENLNPDLLKPYGAQLKGSYNNLFKIRIPISQLENLSGIPVPLNVIRLPLKPHPQEIISQGVGITGTDIWQTEGYKGAGTKIAVIDAGFAGYTLARSTGDLPLDTSTYDYTGTGVATGENHGTAIAEIIYDLAPEAALYLMKIGSEVDLGKAKDDCRALGINIINHSMSWFNSGPGDGTGTISSIAADAYDNGILWVNSTGNFALKHWQGNFTDNNSNLWNEFAPGIELNTIVVNSASYVIIYMRWNDTWNNSNQDYDLYLVNDSSATVAFSRNRQNGLPLKHPIEEISYYALPGNYHVKIRKFNASVNPVFDLFSINNNFTYVVSTGSLCEPADSSKVLSAGALRYNNWDTGPQEYYSSMGPTIDGRIKPDITGPSGVATFTIPSFTGTSPSAPYVAGAASLILCRNNKYAASDVWRKLEKDANDLGDPGKDNVYGAGRLSLKTISPDAPSSPLCERQSNPVNLSPDNPVFSWTFSDPELPYDGQTAYQVIISSMPANINSNIADTSDSGKVTSTSAFTAYTGPALSRGPTYYWEVRAWDQFKATGPYCSLQSFQLSDSTPPCAVTDLRVTGGFELTCELSWTAPGDDGTTGKAARYSIRKSTYPEFDWIHNWNNAGILADNLPVNKYPGEPETASAGPGGGWSYLRMKTSDDAGNWSDLSNLTTYFGEGIIPPPPAENLEHLIVSPNPAKARDTEIHFYNLTPGAIIKIYTLDGELVSTLKSSGYSITAWDIKNTSGNHLASGIYVYAITAPSGEKRTGKFAIIR